MEAYFNNYEFIVKTENKDTLKCIYVYNHPRKTNKTYEILLEKQGQ